MTGRLTNSIDRAMRMAAVARAAGTSVRPNGSGATEQPKPEAEPRDRDGDEVNPVGEDPEADHPVRDLCARQPTRTKPPHGHGNPTGPGRRYELRGRRPSERDLGARCPADAIARPRDHATEQRYLSDQRTRLEDNADCEPCEVTVPQPAERRTETHDVR